MRRVAIVGGGIAGLATAYYLRRWVRDEQDLGITLLEGSPRLGGSIATEHAGGYVIEAGADSFLTTKPWAVELARELGIESRMVGIEPSNRRVFVVRRGLVPLPEGFALVATPRLGPLLRTPLLSPWGKARAALDLVLARRRSNEDESLASFVRRRLGREVLDRIAGPLVAGIHAADPERLSAEATVPQFCAFERDHGSVIRGLRRSSSTTSRAGSSVPTPFASFRAGMGELVDAIVAATPAIDWKTRTPVREIRMDSEGWAVALEDGAVEPADAVVLATPAHVSANLVGNVSAKLADALRTIPYASSVAVSLAFDSSHMALPPGSGFIVPRSEGLALRACTWSSLKFPGRAPADGVLVRLFFGGAGDDRIVHRQDDALVRLALEELEAIVNLRGEPSLVRVHRWPLAHPQYEVGHTGRVASIEASRAEIPHLFLTGSAYRGLGIPDCVRDAQDTATAVLEGITSSLGTPDVLA